MAVRHAALVSRSGSFVCFEVEDYDALMRANELQYDLPDRLIAQRPSQQRSAGRLLVADRGAHRLCDREFSQLPELLKSNDVLVLNNTKVLPAKFFLQRSTGGKIEGLWVGQNDDGAWNVLLRGAGRLRQNEVLRFEARPQEYEVTVLQKGLRGEYLLRVSPPRDAHDLLQQIGLPPLPPYIKRTAHDGENVDRERYQTVYARENGALAAPTAGLHFDNALLDVLRERGLDIVELTLHVGLGTFRPIETPTLEEHQMHSERYRIDPDNWSLIREARSDGRRIVAVGTTSVRALETVVQNDCLEGNTNIFIYPPYTFRVVDALITNFHLPQSTLLAMVYAFGGADLMKRAYAHAIEREYRFYSYGDAMLIE